MQVGLQVNNRNTLKTFIENNKRYCEYALAMFCIRSSESLMFLFSSLTIVPACV